ncbi:MAG: hypothetical protein GX778_01900 [Erysipelothrix sp.]|nr:hypothetical protein [Erysipelothrix sp.]
MKKIIRTSLIGVILLMMFTVTSLAYYSNKITVTVPNWGGSIDSININGQVTKTSTSKSVTFYGVQESASLDAMGRLINSNGEARSDYVTIAQGSYHTSQTNTGVVNFFMYSRVKSHMFEPNNKVVVYQFNPY